MVAFRSRAALCGLPAFLAGATGFVAFILIAPHAFAQSRKADPVVAAQQALARLDYAAASRFALEALRADPRNQEARRIAARSAKEMQRPADCLRLMQPMTPARATTDDVTLVGECASASQFSPWSLSFLNQSTSVPAHMDVANFWLGRYYYRRGDYARAEGFLAKVTVLPARLEKERLFMLERTREVLKAQSAPPSVPEPANETSTGDANPSPDRNVGGSLPPRPTARKEDRDKETAGPTRLSAASRTGLRKNAAGGLFFEPGLRAAAGVGLRKGEETRIDSRSQLPYDTATRSAEPASAVNRIETSDINQVDPFVDVGASFQLGGATTLSAGGGQTRLGVEARAAATHSARELPVYAAPGDSLPPSFSVRTPHKGWALALAPFLDIAANRNFSGGARGGATLSGPAFKGTLGRYEGGGFGRVEFDQYEIRAGGTLAWLTGGNGALGARQAIFDLDIRLGRLGPVGFGAPDGHPLFRFTQSTPTGSSSVVLYTEMEGRFMEFNLAPRLFLGEAAAITLWYRFVSASKRSYVSPTLARTSETELEKAGTWAAIRPNAEFSSASNDLTLEGEWFIARALSVAGGALVRKATARYNEAIIDSYNYADLLDRGGESWTRYFLEVRSSF